MEHEQKTSLIKITGDLDTLENAVLFGAVKESKKHVSSPDAITEQIRIDKNRTPIYLPNVTEPGELKKQRADFFNRIDGSYYRKEPVADTKYTQGDYVSGMGDAILWGLMVKGYDELVEETTETKNSIAFGYVNDSDVPCGLQIITFQLQGKPEYIISHVDSLNKPKEDRHSTVYMSQGIYQVLDNGQMLSLDQVLEEHPDEIAQSFLTPNDLPVDLFNTIKQESLSRDLRNLFTDTRSNQIEVSRGGYEGQIENQPARLISQTVSPISQLDPGSFPKQDQMRPDQLFREAARAQIEAADQANRSLSSTQISNLINSQWVNYISIMMSQAPGAPTTRTENKSSSISKFLRFKEKNSMQKYPELLQLKEQIASGTIENPAAEIKKILEKMCDSKNPKVKEFAQRQLDDQFKMMEQYEEVFKYNVGYSTEAKHLALDTESSSGFDPDSDDGLNDESELISEDDLDPDSGFRPG